MKTTISVIYESSAGQKCDSIEHCIRCDTIEQFVHYFVRDLFGDEHYHDFGTDENLSQVIKEMMLTNLSTLKTSFYDFAIVRNLVRRLLHSLATNYPDVFKRFTTVMAAPLPSFKESLVGIEDAPHDPDTAVDFFQKVTLTDWGMARWLFDKRFVAIVDKTWGVDVLTELWRLLSECYFFSLNHVYRSAVKRGDEDEWVALFKRTKPGQDSTSDKLTTPLQVYALMTLAPDGNRVLGLYHDPTNIRKAAEIQNRRRLDLEKFEDWLSNLSDDELGDLRERHEKLSDQRATLPLVEQDEVVVVPMMIEVGDASVADIMNRFWSYEDTPQHTGEYTGNEFPIPE